MKTIFITIFFFSSTLLGSPRCCPDLLSTLQIAGQLPEARQLIEQVESKGSFEIKAEKNGRYTSNAAWYPNERIVSINLSKPRTQASLICSLLFELNNAANQSQFDHFDRLAIQGQITKLQYIEAIERLEYTSAQNMVRLITLGVKKGIYPPNTSWPMAPNFQEHYRVQREAGHSGAIGSMYEQLQKARMQIR